MSLVLRGALSVLAIIVYGWINGVLAAGSTLVLGQIAGKQFESNDASYLLTTAGFDFFTHLGLPLVILGLVLIAIWWSFIVRIGKPIVVLAIGVAIVQPAQAYYSKYDYTEPYMVLPNESAFWIPDVGDNKNSQVRFDSEEYLRANKIPIKRFIVPHTKLSGSGAFFDFFVPAGRLIIVDRTPFSREWVKDAHRGTSTRDESFPCQTKEGIDIRVGISIGTSVVEDDAPKYLSHFGTTPPTGDRTDPNIIFTSVYYGRSLTDVMDHVERKKVQTLVCNEMMSRLVDEDNSQASQIMDKVATEARDYFAHVGITLDFIGWADTFEFPPSVQTAIDDRYAAQTIAPVLATLKDKAILDSLVKNGWDGKLPTNVSLSWWPTSLIDTINNFFHTKPEATALPPKN